MPGGADFVQKTVHRLETGHTRVWTKAVLAVVVIAAFGVYHLYYFAGLATSQAMDQAQIGRHIAGRQGWTTNFIRPRVVLLCNSFWQYSLSGLPQLLMLFPSPMNGWSRMKSLLRTCLGPWPGTPIAAVYGSRIRSNGPTSFTTSGRWAVPVDGIYLTPVIGTDNKLGNIVKGE